MSFRRLILAFVLLLLPVMLFSAPAAATEIVPAAAPHGARIIVAGTGLGAPDTSVSFAAVGGGRLPARIIARSATLLDVVVPPTAITGEVRVTSGGTRFSTCCAPKTHRPCGGSSRLSKRRMTR